MLTAEDKFAADVLSCVDDLNDVLPGLAVRYEELVVIAALAEHVGGALRIFMRAGLCSAQQARRVLLHVEETAFDASLDSLPEVPERVQ